MIYFLYEFIFIKILRLAFSLLALKDPKVKRGLEMRASQEGVAPWLKGPKDLRPIWIHCASMEFEYAKPVIREIKRTEPDLKIMVTYFSPSVEKAIHSFAGIDFATVLPWDQTRPLREFIHRYKPRALLIARTDTWPIMLREAYLNRVPALLFSATLTDASGRMSFLGRFLMRRVLIFLDQIFCVSDSDREQFARIGLAEITRVAGDTRYDQVMHRLENPKPVKDFLFRRGSTITFIAGSSWPEDEVVLLDLMRKTRDLKLQYVLVPHEPTPDHLEALEEKIAATGLKSLRYSAVTTPTATESETPAILLVDQIGILAELYLKADFAFVGGSFRKTVHSVMEPLAAGCITFVGPKHLNNREAIEFRHVPLSPGKELMAVTEVSNAAAWEQCLRSLIPLKPEWKIELVRQVTARQGGTQAIMDWLKQSI